MTIRIILADDHKILRQGLRSLLEKENDFEVVAEADDGRETLELVANLLPDVVIMDIGMPNLNGIEATRQIHSMSPDIKVLALSMHAEEQFVAEMLRAGAAGYLLKDCAYDELVRAIRTIVSGRAYLSPDIAGILVREFLTARTTPQETSSPFSVLTPREREVLQLIAEGNTTKQIAKILGVSVKTIDTHRQQIMQKLDIHNVAELTRYAIKEGLTPLEE